MRLEITLIGLLGCFKTDAIRRLFYELPDENIFICQN